MWAYFDTSALVKRYMKERGRREVLQLLRRYDVVTSAVVSVEIRSALRRRASEGTLDAGRVPEILKRVETDRPYWTLVEVASEVLVAAETLVATHPLRTLDAIHVASAQIFAARITKPALMFVSAGARQIKAAVAVGMTSSHVGP
ncbi:MAG: type II toxin-antitoxin system VapC family toxin [Acidobacteria bacterium]|nr:type II toxin-antitoxin system VapC family toxin [Acidobacteriota bacterium]